MSCSMSNEQKLCEVKIFQLQSMSNAIRCIDQRFALKNSRISCLALIFNLNNRRTTILYTKISVAGGEIRRYTAFFEEWIRTYGLAVKVSRMESGDMVSISDECWNSRSPTAWHWARQCTDTRAFILQHSLLFFFLGFRQWRSRAERVVNLNTTIRLPLFWRTWSLARASTRLHVRAWHMSRDYSDCRASELTDSKVSGYVYSWFLEKYSKTEGLVRDFSKAHAQDWCVLRWF